MKTGEIVIQETYNCALKEYFIIIWYYNTHDCPFRHVVNIPTKHKGTLTNHMLTFISVFWDLSGVDWLWTEVVLLRAEAEHTGCESERAANMERLWLVRWQLLLLPLLLLLLSDCKGRESELNYVTCGSLVKLLNTRHNVRLHSHDVKYGSGNCRPNVKSKYWPVKLWRCCFNFVKLIYVCESFWIPSKALESRAPYS